MPAKDSYLKISDCDLEKAERYPGKYESCFNSKTDWVADKVRIWYEHMKDNPKYDDTPNGHKSYVLHSHLSKLKVAHSEVRKLLVDIEINSKSTESESDASDIEMEVDQGEDVMEVEEPQGSQDMFAASDDGNESTELTRSEKEAAILRHLSNPFEELIEVESELPKFLTQSYRYKEKKTEFIKSKVETFLTDKNSQDVCEVLSQLPSYVTNSDIWKNRFNLSDQQKSQKRMLKNINITFNLLKESSTPASMEQRKVLAAALYDPKFGYPNIDETRTVKNAGKALKTKLLGGENLDLKPKNRTTSDHFPDTVKQIADKCWRTQCTVIEPGKHSRPKAALKDGEERIPAIYQTLTDKEAYSIFEDMYKAEVNQTMIEECNKLRAEVNLRNDSQLKAKLLAQISKKETRFPSMSWFLQQKPKETKSRSDHCTGLCRDCEGPQLNYDCLIKYQKKFCNCRTKECPKWFCACDTDEFGNLPAICSCDPCDCDECLKCEVRKYIATNLSCLTKF